ncbi:hypothetical protein [Selenihalanaerobacter shriftii]|uniref:Uncharacterized protein n=1 Tax=Selenihalanaerobacter shriftii TaxID=142842 RepID=A0A1T4LEC5_9FIRM|nr:hypothetical protein [Selenihalanaerobacter shriftii]SJZ52824.1 hypothetical protein SAMN02745118_01093 [Selenihalanaerobacter shriftii]
MKRKVSLLLIILLIMTLMSSIVIAKPKKGKFKQGKFKHGKKKSKKHAKKDYHDNSNSTDFVKNVFNIEDQKIRYFKKFDLKPEELSFILYLHSMSNRPVTDKEVNFIISNKNNWGRVTWHFGLPPIMFEEEILTFRHPMQTRSRLYLPLGKTGHKSRHRGFIKEKLNVDYNKYEYKYENKRAKIKEKIEIKLDKYEYKYENRRSGIKEKLEVKYPSYKYEYHYINRMTGKNIKQEGIGRPINPRIFYKNLRNKKDEDSNFHLSININIDL